MHTCWLDCWDFFQGRITFSGESQSYFLTQVVCKHGQMLELAGSGSDEELEALQSPP